MPSTPTYRKKLIEVDLPLDAINAETVKDRKAPGRAGQPSALHQWWARRPITACRAVLWASIVNDPSSCPDEFPSLEDQAIERRRLHEILVQLIKWENANDINVLTQARFEIAKSIARETGETRELPKDIESLQTYLAKYSPTIYDPFCGGGSIPLEVQRLGLKAAASDLNPVAVLITKAMIELPPKFSNSLPSNPDHAPLISARNTLTPSNSIKWQGTTGLADDLRWYGRWITNQAFERIGHCYPPIEDEDGRLLDVMTWLWVRTVNCPNPACNAEMPLLRSFQISRKRGSERWVRPIYDSVGRKTEFVVQDNPSGVPENGTVNRNGATCLVCGTVTKLGYVRDRGSAGQFRNQLLAIVAEDNRKRVFISPIETQEDIANSCRPKWVPQGKLPTKALSIRPQLYGFRDWHSLFTDRQKLVITTMCDLVKEVGDVVLEQSDGNTQYSKAIQLYLALAVGKLANSNNAFAVWDSNGHAVKNMFSRQGIGMTWDFPEANPFSQTGKNFLSQLNALAKSIELLPLDPIEATVWQHDASSPTLNNGFAMFVTDPPYYDNIHYSDSSDFFYVWLRSMLRENYPELFGGMLTPKNEEIVANRFRDENPEEIFETKLASAIASLRRSSTELSAFFYAYKQQDKVGDERSSSGWDTMLTAITDAGFQIVATWPLRTELTSALKKSTNSLATSVVIVVRARQEDAPIITRQQFYEELERELPLALERLTRGGHIAPADLPQAAIGPGMEIFTKYRGVETIAGESVSVRDALLQVNRIVASYFDREEGELDTPSRFCVDWLRTRGYIPGSFGEADNIARAKNVSVTDVANIHRLVDNSRGGIVQLAPISEYRPERRYPMTDLTAWEGCMRMAYHLDTSNEDGKGVVGCGEVGRRMAGNIDSVERLAHILYNHYDNVDQPRNAYIYNQLVSEWQNILNATQSPETPTLV